MQLLKLELVLFVCAVLLLITPFSSSADFTGQVIKVEDGDTLVVTYEYKKIIVKLAGIDAPEINQAYGKEAKFLVEKIALNQLVEVNTKDKITPLTEKTSGDVCTQNKRRLYIIRELIRSGLAWCNTQDRKYPASSLMRSMEAVARKNKIGLWSDPDAIPPWEFRVVDANRIKVAKVRAEKQAEEQRNLIIILKAQQEESNRKERMVQLEKQWSEAMERIKFSQDSIEPSQVLDSAKIVEIAKPAVVTVLTDRGIGSGFFISKDGYVLTNAHVVKDNNTVTLKLTNDVTMDAKVIKVDHAKDIALLQAIGLSVVPPFLPLGDSGSSQVGESVVAIGSPLGLEGTVTKGIVSAVNMGSKIKDNSVKPVPAAHPNITYIQTDAAINHGNSGGPLLNSKGEVIGINTWGLTSKLIQNNATDSNTKTEVMDSEGLNFAISVNDVKQFIGE